jgi:methylthioribose-1-phosphate isomerase
VNKHARTVTPPAAVRWSADGGVDLLDQTLLPSREQHITLHTADDIIEAIRMLRVRGAPAIGIAGAMGVVVEATRLATEPAHVFRDRVIEAAKRIASARPTAVNLAWAVKRTVRAAGDATSNDEAVRRMRVEATRILEEDQAMCRAIGEHALALLGNGARVLTQCNAGALATGGIGTALAPVYIARERGIDVRVWAPETRPLLQGSRITAWEMERAGVDVTLLPDSAAASLFASGGVDLVIVGADRIAANGDVANKVGTYGLAVLASVHDVPFYVAAPTSTLDPSMPDGRSIPIENRSADEVRRGFGTLTAPPDVPVYSPAFDITPASLISAIVTERGILRPPYDGDIARHVRESDRWREAR